MSSKSKPKAHKFYILGKHNRKHKPKRRHENKYQIFSKAPTVKCRPLHRRARYTTH